MHDSGILYPWQPKQFQAFLDCDVLIVNWNELLSEYFHAIRGVVRFDVFDQRTLFYVAFVKCLAGMLQHFDVVFQLAQKLRGHLLQFCMNLLPEFSQLHVRSLERIVLVVFCGRNVDVHVFF